MATENTSARDTKDKVSGAVWVREGRVYVADPSGTGTAPTITPCEGIDLFINGNKVFEKTAVREADEILLTPHTSEEPGEFKVRVARDGLSARLEIVPAEVSRYVVEDCGPEEDLVLKAERVVERKCPVSLDDLTREINRQNIVYGLKHSEIQSVLLNPAQGSYLIAEGDPPGKPVHGRVEIHFTSEPKGGSEEDRVDFRDMSEIPTVEPGQLLAVKHPPSQGIPGRTVTGDIVLPEKPQVFEMTGGKGVDMSSNGTMAFARIGGRPVAKKAGNRYSIDVDPVLHHRGDVNISTGNIRFKGDIVIHGNVSEGMTIQAAGKINIMGMVFESRIATQGDITVAQNITGSSLVAGGNNTFFNDLAKILETLHGVLLEIARALPDMARHPQLKDVKTGQIIQFLIDRKYVQVPTMVAKLTRLVGQSSFILPGDLEKLIGGVEQNLKGLNLLRIDSIAGFHKIVSELEEARIIIDGMAKDEADIVFGYAINSTLEASGDVRVVGRGCINTVIRAGGGVTVKGVFRGGEIAARGDVILDEAGSELGVRTLIKAGNRGKVYIKKAYEGVQVQIGDRRVQLNSLQQNFKAVLDAAGDIRILG